MMNSEGSLFALWHGRMLVGIPSQTQLRMSVLVSPSRDGSIMDPILNSFSYSDRFAGSTSRGGARALRELLNRLRAGGRIVITPDGPRGPMHSMNEGLAWMARATGFPVLPVGLACDRHWSMSSWDRFTIPKWRAKNRRELRPTALAPEDLHTRGALSVHGKSARCNPRRGIPRLREARPEARL